MHGVLFIFSYYFLNLRSIIFLQSPEQVRIERLKCEHAVASRMLAFESLYPQMLRWPDRFFHVQLPRFASQHHAIFLPRRIKHACSIKHLEFRNIPCAVLKFRPGARFYDFKNKFSTFDNLSACAPALARARAAHVLR